MCGDGARQGLERVCIYIVSIECLACALYNNFSPVKCDDGNLLGGDGCSTNCVVEPGFRCSFSPQASDWCDVGCGDGVKTDSEECDDGV